MQHGSARRAILSKRCSTSWRLNPSSVEYFSRNAESLSQLFNMFNRFALGPAWITALTNLNLQALAIQLLRGLGYSGTALPDLLNHYFLTDNPQITTSSMMSRYRRRIQSAPIPPTSATTSSGSLMQPTQSLDTLREESGFTNNQTPQALLYLLLRHALHARLLQHKLQPASKRGISLGLRIAGDAHRADVRSRRRRVRARARAASVPFTKLKAASPGAPHYW